MRVMCDTSRSVACTPQTQRVKRRKVKGTKLKALAHGAVLPGTQPRIYLWISWFHKWSFTKMIQNGRFMHIIMELDKYNY